MNNDIIENAINRYLENFEEYRNRKSQDNPKGHDEGYKWRAIIKFQNNWDLSAENFQEMFNKAVGVDAGALTNKAAIHPLNAVRELFKFGDGEFVREQFGYLFSEDGGDLDKRQKRVEEFCAAINERHVYRVPNTIHNFDIDTVLFFLSFWKPEENYMYSSYSAKLWARAMDYNGFESKREFSLKKYYDMCEATLGIIKNNQELLAVDGKWLEEENLSVDDGLHIYTYDFIYCYKAYMEDLHVLPIPKISTKKKQETASIQKEIEGLEAELNEAQKSVNEDRLAANESFVAVKNVGEILRGAVGLSVHNKKYGDGVIISCSESDGAKKDYKHKVKFGDTETVFNCSIAYKTGSLSVNDEEKNGRILKAIEALNEYNVVFEKAEKSEKKLSDITKKLEMLKSKL